jgi:hypothetical protein
MDVRRISSGSLFGHGLRSRAIGIRHDGVGCGIRSLRWLAQNEGQTRWPSKLRAHSDLLLTARNKAGTARAVRDSWAGEHPQTTLLPDTSLHLATTNICRPQGRIGATAGPKSEMPTNRSCGFTTLARLPGLIVVCFGRFWVRGLPFPNARHLGHPFQWKNTLPWHLGPAKSESSASKIFRHSGITLVFKYHV